MPKPSIAVILGGKAPKAPDSEPDMDDEEGEDMGAHKQAAMSEFIDAVKSGDVAKACEAFDALKALPEDDYEEGE